MTYSLEETKSNAKNVGLESTKQTSGYLLRKMCIIELNKQNNNVEFIQLFRYFI